MRVDLIRFIFETLLSWLVIALIYGFAIFFMGMIAIPLWIRAWDVINEFWGFEVII